MSQYRYSPEGRAALRDAIRAHVMWPDLRAEYSITLNGLYLNLETIADACGIDPAAYAMPPKAAPSRFKQAARHVRHAWRALSA